MFWGHVLRLARRLFFRSGQQKEEQVLQEEEGYENPYLGQLRRIIEQILEQKKIPYGQFAPVFLDGNDSQYALWAADLLGRDLNRLTILTEHPAYFERFADNMYEEHGLIAEVFFKERRKLHLRRSYIINYLLLLYPVCKTFYKPSIFLCMGIYSYSCIAFALMAAISSWISSIFSLVRG